MGRKLVGWFKVYSDILEDPRLMGEDWKLAAYVRLLAMVNRSESRDGILRLPYRALGVAMGRSRRDVALKRLRLLVQDGLSCAALYEHYVLIILPKYLERYGNAVPEKCPTKTKTKTKTKKPPLSPPSARPTKKPRTSAPDDFTGEQLMRLGRWAEENEPWAAPRVGEFTLACLDHHRSKGTTSTDWVLNVHGWIRNHKQWHGTGTNGGTHGPKPGTLDAACADQLERIDREERENAARDKATSQLSLSSGRES